jgi:competence protein ComEA
LRHALALTVAGAMGEIGRPQLAVYVAAAIAIALVGARYLREQGGGSPGSSSAAPAAGVRVQQADGRPAVVDVAGAVRRPGVYRLPASARVDDAVREAGGPKRNADLTGLNLAAKVEDGRQYVVPEKVRATAAAPAGDPGAAPAAAPTPSAPLNLNTATAEQLDQLDGVGPETARKIVAYRRQKGGFGSVEELDQVPGIGPQRLAALRDLVTV